MFRWITLFICMLVLVGGLAFLAPIVTQQPVPQDSSSGKAAIGGHFTMTKHTGEEVHEDLLEGKYSLVFFGFTHCPDVCPTSLLVISNAIESLPAAMQDKVQGVFVSVDPERDTTERLATYVGNFSNNIIGITGTPEQVKHIAQLYKVYYSRVDQPNSEMSYLVDHSSFIFLMGPDGNYITHFAHGIAPQEMVKTLMEQMN